MSERPAESASTLERLRKRLDRIPDSSDVLVPKDELRAALADVVRLRAALGRFGVHSEDCQLSPVWQWGDKVCTCGLAAALEVKDG